MIRAGDVFYPSQYPQQMSDSLGVDTSEVPPGQGGAPTYPSQSLINRTYTPAPATTRNGSAPAYPDPPAARPVEPVDESSGTSIGANGNANANGQATSPSQRPAVRPTWVTAETTRSGNGAASEGSNGSGSSSLGARRESLSRLRESNLRDERD